MQENYAIKIARDWNVPSDGMGFVTKFEVEVEYLSQFEIHYVGGKEHAEYWIPAESLEEFNHHLVGLIQVVAEF